MESRRSPSSLHSAPATAVVFDERLAQNRAVARARYQVRFGIEFESGLFYADMAT